MTVSKRAALRQAEILATYQRLRAFHVDAHCELEHRNPFELLCATVLSAQATDVSVNKATPALFLAYPNAQAMAKAAPADVEELINRIGMYRQKAKNLIGLSRMLVELYDGQVPHTPRRIDRAPGRGAKDRPT